MKYLKNISLFAIAFMVSAQMFGSVNQNSQFKEETDENWIFNKTVSTQKHGTMYTSIFGKHPNGRSVLDTTSEDLLSNRVTHKNVETVTENGVSIVTTKTWVSRNPSYVTWVNGALVIGAIAGTILGAAAIHALGNVGAAGVNAYGNVGASVVNASGNIGAAAISNPASAVALGTALGSATGDALNNNPEGQKFMKMLNTEMEKKQQQNAAVAA
jgi:hypothetical protein